MPSACPGNSPTLGTSPATSPRGFVSCPRSFEAPSSSGDRRSLDERAAVRAAASFTSSERAPRRPGASFRIVEGAPGRPAALFSATKGAPGQAAASFSTMQGAPRRPAASFPVVPEAPGRPAASFPVVPEAPGRPAASFPVVPEAPGRPAASFPVVPEAPGRPAASFPVVPEAPGRPAASFPVVPEAPGRPAAALPRIKGAPSLDERRCVLSAQHFGARTERCLEDRLVLRSPSELRADVITVGSSSSLTRIDDRLSASQSGFAWAMSHAWRRRSESKFAAVRAPRSSSRGGRLLPPRHPTLATPSFVARKAMDRTAGSSRGLRCATQ